MRLEIQKNWSSPGARIPRKAERIIQQIIGVDCSTRPSRVGLARAVNDASAWRLDAVCTGGNSRSPAEIVSAWIADSKASSLLTLDAPLGWPAPLSRALRDHRAGRPLNQPSNRLFRRETDRVIRKVTGKQSLDVGADRRSAMIATACRAALARHP